ncbi:MAG: transposase [Desulfobacterales bacterium]|nr:transposase [Desulfobacterales bacterium]
MLNAISWHEWQGSGAGLPHYITQRGNRRQQTFFSDQDLKADLALMAEWCSNYKPDVWASCLMPNHIHLMAGPGAKDGLDPAVGEAHQRYTRRSTSGKAGAAIYGKSNWRPLLRDDSGQKKPGRKKNT